MALSPIVALGRLTPAEAEEALELFLTRPNVFLIRRYGLPSLFKSGIVYVREPVGKEIWQPANVLARSRKGDCEDLSCYLSAELRLRGTPARTIIRPNRSGGYHAVVKTRSGIVDPSRALGM